MEILLLILAILAVLGLGILVGVFYFKCDYAPPKRKQLEDLPRCTCNEVNECDIWCRAKELFSKQPTHSSIHEDFHKKVHEMTKQEYYDETN